ncbi:MAG: TIGR01620 family protein [Magnetococcus sp. DMHC-1]
MLKPASWLPPIEIRPAARAPVPPEAGQTEPVILASSTRQGSLLSDPESATVIQGSMSPDTDPEAPEASMQASATDDLNENRGDSTSRNDTFASQRPAIRERWGTLALVLAGVFLLLVLLQNLILYLWQEMTERPLLGTLMTVLALGGVVSATLWIGREWYRLARLREMRSLAEEAAILATRRKFAGDAWGLTQQLVPLYQHDPEAMAGLARFNLTIDDTLEDSQILRLFARQVLAPVDSRAHRVVVRHVSSTTLLTALSPFPLVDALLFLWHNLRMVREIAQCYGVHPGTMGSWILLRDGCQGLLVAGTTDLLANQVSNLLGNSLASMLLARAGQGIANGLFTARIGLQAMHLCRPVPFADEELAIIGQWHKTMAASLTQTFQGNVSNKTPREDAQPG